MADAAGVKPGVVGPTRRTWYLPETKNQRDHSIHLSDFALSHLQALAALREIDSAIPGAVAPWAFPGIDGAAPVGVKSLGKQFSDRELEPQRRLAGRAKDRSALLLPEPNKRQQRRMHNVYTSVRVRA